MRYTEKINRLKEFLPFFEEYLSQSTADSILYISLRRNTTWSNVILLVGLNNLECQHEIATYASRIIIDIQGYLETNGMHTHEQECTIKRVNCFEFDLEKKAKKDAAIKEWEENPFDFFEYVGEGVADSICAEYMVWQGYKINLFVPAKGARGRGYGSYNDNLILGSIYLGLYDFKVTDRYGKSYSYLKIGKYLFIKYRTDDKPELITTKHIGVVKFDSFGFDKCRYTEVSKTTYNKWAKVAEQEQ